MCLIFLGCGVLQLELQAAHKLQSDEKIAKAHRMIGEAQVQLAEYDKALQNTQKYYGIPQYNARKVMASLKCIRLRASFYPYFAEWACAHDDRLVEQQRALTTLGRTNLVKADSIKDKEAPECKNAYNLAVRSLWKSLKICEQYVIMY